MVALKLLVAAGFVSSAAAVSRRADSPAASISCNGKKYVYNGLAGFGSLASDARDEYGDTISIGSAAAVKDWVKTGNKYKGTLYGVPDRGWNTNGTINAASRVHIFDITFAPAPDASVAKPSGPNLNFEYKRTILLKGPDGKLVTGLDADFSGGLTYPGFPTVPAATYPGDGFGGAGPGDKRIAIDAEGLVVEDDGSLWISDEYGPFVYRFNSKGEMVAAVQPPDSIVPLRKGKISYNSNTPPIYDKTLVPDPADPTHGRQNNQGFEGLTLSRDGKTLWVMLQSAARQDGGSAAAKRRNTRLLKYSLKPKAKGDVDIVYEAQYVVPLPTFVNADNATRVAAQSEIHYISDTQFLVLPRDSSVGRGMKNPLSLYRHVDVVDISNATNIKGKFDDIQNGNITLNATSDVLVEGITPAELCPWIDYNLNTELGKFKTSEGDVIHNGAPANFGLLNEKWEALALVPVNANGKNCDKNNEYYLITLSDNDFVTNNGYANFGKFRFVDDSTTVPFLNSQALVFKIKLPDRSKPLIG